MTELATRPNIVLREFFLRELCKTIKDRYDLEEQTYSYAANVDDPIRYELLCRSSLYGYMRGLDPYYNPEFQKACEDLVDRHCNMVVAFLGKVEEE